MHRDLLVGQGVACGGAGGLDGRSGERNGVVVECVENSVAGATVEHVHDVETRLHAGGRESERALIWWWRGGERKMHDSFGPMSTTMLITTEGRRREGELGSYDEQ